MLNDLIGLLTKIEKTLLHSGGMFRHDQIGSLHRESKS